MKLKKYFNVPWYYINLQTMMTAHHKYYIKLKGNFLFILKKMLYSCTQFEHVHYTEGTLRSTGNALARSVLLTDQKSPPKPSAVSGRGIIHIEDIARGDDYRGDETEADMYRRARRADHLMNLHSVSFYYVHFFDFDDIVPAILD